MTWPDESILKFIPALTPALPDLSTPPARWVKGRPSGGAGRCWVRRRLQKGHQESFTR